MATSCIGPRGEDLCHIGRQPPIVDFYQLQRLRKERSVKEAQSKQMRDDRVDKMARRAITAVARADADARTLTPFATRQGKGRSEERSEERSEDRSEERLDDDSAPNTYRQTNPRLRANTQSLNVEEMDKARMVRAGKTFYKQGVLAAQSQLDATLSPEARGWRIDSELSSNEGLVLEKNGRVRIAYRGTDFLNMNDIVTDAAAAAGVEKLAPQMRESRMQIENVYAKYGQLPSELLGYSKGGAHAFEMGDRFGIKTTTFNPLVGRKQLMSKSSTSHTIIRTVEDPVSALLALAKGKRNFTVKGIDPIFGLGDPKNAHELTHFTSAGARQPGGLEQLMHDGVRKGQMLSHLETLDHFKTAQEQGLSFTEALDKFNTNNGATQRVDVLEDGSLGPRIHKEAGSVKYWRDAGGTFTAAEQAHLESNPIPPKRVYSDEAKAMGLHEELTDAQRKYVTSLSSEERKTFMRQQRTAMEQHNNTLNESVRPHETVIKGMMPKAGSLATGAVAGFAAHALMNVVDPDHKMNRIAEEATEGAIAGGIGVGAASALGASAALGPEILAGAAGYVAGAESASAITSALEKGGMNRGGAEAIGGVSGGAIGGATTAVVGAGAVVLGGMAFGAEEGATLGIVGGPVGVAVGAAGGAALGAAIGGIGVLFSRWTHEASSAVHHVGDVLAQQAGSSDTWAGNLASLPTVGSNNTAANYTSNQSQGANAYTNVIVSRDEQGVVTGVSYDAST